MELSEAMRTTGAVRDFLDEPVTDHALYRVLSTARFAPSGGNRQGWRVVVVKDPAVRAALRDVYLGCWYEYLSLGAAGLVPWSPANDRQAEAAALSGAAELRRQAAAGPGGFAEHLDAVPVLLVVLVDLRALATVDRDADRYTFAGGASVYPFCQNVLLAARDEGLAGLITTVAIRREPELLALLGAPDHLAVAAVMALGKPRRQPQRLTRRPVEEFTTVDRVDGRPFGAPDR